MTTPEPTPAPQPTQAPAPVYYQQRTTNILAIIGLVASCVAVFLPITAIAGIVMGHIGLSQIKRTGENGHGMALAAVIVGYCLAGLWVLFIIAYIIFIVVLVGYASTNPGQFQNFG